MSPDGVHQQLTVRPSSVVEEGLRIWRKAKTVQKSPIITELIPSWKKRILISFFFEGKEVMLMAGIRLVRQDRQMETESPIPASIVPPGIPAETQDP